MDIGVAIILGGFFVLAALIILIGVKLMVLPLKQAIWESNRRFTDRYLEDSKPTQDCGDGWDECPTCHGSMGHNCPICLGQGTILINEEIKS